MSPNHCRTPLDGGESGLLWKNIKGISHSIKSVGEFVKVIFTPEPPVGPVALRSSVEIQKIEL